VFLDDKKSFADLLPDSGTLQHRTYAYGNHPIEDNQLKVLQIYGRRTKISTID
jgi:hypothetical protein